jgi:GTP cyclohydrolase IA
MKQNGTLWNTPANVLEETGFETKETLANMKEVDGIGTLTIDEIGDEHIATSYDTPLRPDAFDLSEEEKMDIIAGHFKEIMLTLGLDLTDDSLKGTPKRVAKMYVQEIFNGLDPKNLPKVALFDNKYKYNEMLVEKNIRAVK